MDVGRPYVDVVPGVRGAVLAVLAQLAVPVTVRALARHAGVSPQGALQAVNELARGGHRYRHARRAGADGVTRPRSPGRRTDPPARRATGPVGRPPHRRVGGMAEPGRRMAVRIGGPRRRRPPLRHRPPPRRRPRPRRRVGVRPALASVRRCGRGRETRPSSSNTPAAPSPLWSAAATHSSPLCAPTGSLLRRRASPRCCEGRRDRPPEPGGANPPPPPPPTPEPDSSMPKRSSRPLPSPPTRTSSPPMPFTPPLPPPTPSAASPSANAPPTPTTPPPSSSSPWWTPGSPPPSPGLSAARPRPITKPVTSPPPTRPPASAKPQRPAKRPTTGFVRDPAACDAP